MTTSAERAADPSAREGFAAGLITHMFPGLRKQHPKQFAADVQFIYDWEASVKGGTFFDPLNLKANGEYASRHAAMVRTADYIDAPKQHALWQALQRGDYGAAKKAVNGNGASIAGKSTLPSPIDPKTGDYAPSQIYGTWDQILGTVGGMPGQAGKDLTSGIPSFLSSHMVLIVVLLALILILGKKR